MASLEHQIALRVQADLQGIDGTGSYTYNLSGSDQVFVGDTFQPDRVPSIYIHIDSVETRQDPGRTVLTRYDHTMTVDLVGYVAATSDSLGSAVLAACDLGADMRIALEADRTLNGLVRDLEIAYTATSSDSLDLGHGVGVLLGRLTITYTRAAGT